jgi:hypothetical protein
MLDNLDYHIQNQIYSFCDIYDIVELLQTSKQIRINGVKLNGVKVTGINMHCFVQWLRKHNIHSIDCLIVENYIMNNDHCMDLYVESCDCVEEIKHTLGNINIKKLSLISVFLDEHVINWKGVESLHLGDCRFNNEWINNQKDLKDLTINGYFTDGTYPPFTLIDEKIKFFGLKLPSLESFESNGFIFGEQLDDFLAESEMSQTLKLFKIQSWIDLGEWDYQAVLRKVKTKFPNVVMKVYL